MKGVLQNWTNFKWESKAKERWLTTWQTNTTTTNKQTNVERKERDKRGEGREERTKNGIKHCKEKNEKKIKEKGKTMWLN